MKKYAFYLFIFFIMVTTLSSIACESYYPILPKLEGVFHTSSEFVNMSVSVFLLGMGLTAILFGHLSDVFGRKKIMIITIFLGMAGTVICMFSVSIEMIILGRLIQGMGFSGVGTLGKSILRDKFNGLELAKYISLIGICVAVIRGISPYVATVLSHYLGWRMSFLAIILYSVMVLILIAYFKEESFKRDKLDILHLPISVIHHFKDITFLKYTLVSAIDFAALTTYFIAASYVFQNSLHLTSTQYGLYNFGMIFFLVMWGFLNKRLLEQFSLKTLIKMGMVCYFLGGVGVVYSSFHLSLLGLTVTVAIIFLGSCLMGLNSSALAFLNTDKKVGSASATYFTVQMVVGVCVTQIFSLLSDVSLLALGIMIIVLVVGALGIVLYPEKRKIQCGKGCRAGV